MSELMDNNEETNSFLDELEMQETGNVKIDVTVNRDSDDGNDEDESSYVDKTYEEKLIETLVRFIGGYKVNY